MTRLLAMMNAAERACLLVLLLLLLAMAVVEVVGIAAVAAFFALISDPESVASNRWLSTLHHWLGEPDRLDMLAGAGAVLFAIIAFRNIFGALCVWYRLRFLHGMRRDMATRLLQGYLAQPFSFFQRANSAGLTKNITYEINQLVTSYLYSWVTLVADAVTSIAVLILLLWNDPWVTMIAMTALAVLAGGALAALRQRVRTLGVTHRALNESLYKTTAEALGGVKELKVLGREGHFVRLFASVADRFARTAIVYQLLVDLPRYVLEIVVTGGILVLAWVLFARSPDPGQAAATLALFVAALYRLMPVVHRMFSCIAGLNFNRAILNDLSGILADAADADLGARPTPLPFEQGLRLDDVYYRYAGTQDGTLRGVSLDVPRNAAIALVGPTGVGKTTLVDIVLGLLTPTSGQLLVDGAPVTAESVRAWRANVGYVPQTIFLLDDSIRRNIALGVPDDEIDEARLVEAVQAAHLQAFVGDLADGLDTVVGERGIRLSGGQRQRIGIARALYARAGVLVLDEATSSLDGITETVVEQAIADLHGQLTVITIAHRLTTVRHCDVIHVMEAGRIVASGSYSDLMRENETFRRMARVAG